MYLNLPNGTELIFKNADDATNYISGLERKVITTSPENLVVKNNGRTLSLLAEGKSFPIRLSFLHKLLKWYNFPLGQIRYLDVETITSILNDYLINIKSSSVNVTLEDNQALTITSDRYGNIEDLELIKHVKPLGILMIMKNDFMTSIITETKEKVIPYPNDEFGIGISMFNSETGFRAFTINSYLLRYTCSNGAYIKSNNSEKKYYHYDLNIPMIYEEVEQSIKKLAEEKEHLKERIAMLKEARDFEKTKEKVIEIMIRKIGKKRTEKIFVYSDDIKNNYDLFNHITFKAKEFEISTRIMLEEIAGELLFFN